MVKDDKYSDKEFDSEEEMHLYWAENHMDDLNSHDKEKAKKALKRKEDKKQEKMEQRKQMMFKGVAGVAVLAVLYFAAPAVMSVLAGGGTINYDDLQLEDQPAMGSEDAPVTVVEFGDYLCPACQQFEQQVKPELMEMIDDGDVRFHYMDINLPQFQPNNGQASIAAQCVFQQDEEQFWEFHRSLFDNQGQITYSAEGLRSQAEESTEGLDYDELESCIDNRETSEAVDRDNEIARNNGVSSTPTVFVNGDRVSSWNELPRVIEEEYL